MKPWLARYGIDTEGYAADLLAAGKMKRAEAAAKAADHAAKLGIADLPDPDVKLKVDWNVAAREALIADWGKAIRANPKMSTLTLAFTRLPPHHRAAMTSTTGG